MTVLSHHEGSQFLQKILASREIYRPRYKGKCKLYQGERHLDFGLPDGMGITEVGWNWIGSVVGR
jgi:hypothetical protein